MSKTASLAGLLAWVLMGAIDLPAAGLLRSPDFAPPGTPAAASQVAWKAATIDRDSWRVRPGQGPNGKGSIRFEGPSGRAAAPLVHDVACETNSDYVIVCWTKSDGKVIPLVQVVAPESGNKALVIAYGSEKASWRRVVRQFNTGPNSRLSVKLYGASEHVSVPAKPGPAGVTDFGPVELWRAAEFPESERAPAGLMRERPGRNLALHKPYSFDPAPNYSLTTDTGDLEQLTDGKYTTGSFWGEKSTVGWQPRNGVATVSIDLGASVAIGGVSVNMAAGVSGASWPVAIELLVSEDGKSYVAAGELIGLSVPNGLPRNDSYSVHRYWTDALDVRARFFRVVIHGSPYIFVDEIEVYAPATNPARKIATPRGVTPAAVVGKVDAIGAGVRRRLVSDIQELDEALANASLSALDRKHGAVELAEIAAAAKVEGVTAVDFKAVLPVSDLHRRLLRLQALMWRGQGVRRPVVWAADRWAAMDFIAPLPDQTVEPVLDVFLMRGEYRSAAFNISNPLDSEVMCRMDLTGMSAGFAATGVTIREVVWTDTKSGMPVASALPDAAPLGHGFKVVIPAGVTRQVWLTVRGDAFAPGSHVAKIACSGLGGPVTEVPLKVEVSKVSFPARPTLSLGGWDYMDSDFHMVTGQNREALAGFLRERFVDAPWARGSALPFSLDFRTLDKWIELWPEARGYYFFLNVGPSYGGIPAGTPEFDSRVGGWITACVKHLRTRGVPPERVAVHIQDEPTLPAQFNTISAWSRAIRRAEPGVIVWTNPSAHADAAAAKAILPECDVVCLHRPNHVSGSSLYRELLSQARATGKRLAMYSCTGPISELDPYSYHRLQAWSCWEAGATAEFFWAFSDTGAGSSWNEYQAPGSSYCPLFLDRNSVTTAKHMEAIREGVQDYEYLVILQQQIAAAEKRQPGLPELRRARDLVLSAPATVLHGQGADNLMWRKTKDRSVADSVRRDLFEAIETLAKP